MTISKLATNDFYKLVVILLLLSGQPVYSFNETGTRLTHDWKFLRSDLGGIWEAVRPVKFGDPESVPLWENVELPHCFNATDAVDPDVNYYQGPGWYTNRLNINNPYTDGRTLLHFEGAGQKTDVYIYTTKVGSHVGGYDEWTVDITEAVNSFMKDERLMKQFKNKVPLSIRCDNSRDLEMIPSDLSDFNVYGGLYRYVNLNYVPSLAIKQVHVRTSTDADGKKGIIGIDLSLDNHSMQANAILQIELLDPAGKVFYTAEKQIQPNEEQKNIFSYEIRKPALWSTVSPALYQCRISLHSGKDTHRVTDRFGFRHFEFIEHGPFKLNGKRLLLNGTHRHEDHANVGAALTEQMMLEEMILMKDMGVNFIRLGHYQQSRTILELCDSLGILVWEEIPWCRGGLGGEKYKAMAREMLTNMIAQHYNHPSVIIWGLGNENDWPGDFAEFDKLKIRKFMKELHEFSHQLDPTRKTAIRRCDFCKDIVDVYSPSIWAGWYRGIYNEYKPMSEYHIKNLNHFFHAEWGGDSHAGRHSETPEATTEKIKTGQGVDERAGDASLYGGSTRVSKDGDWSESYICNLFEWHLKEQGKMPDLTGSAFWVFKDFSTPVRPENPVPYMNQKGVVERDNTPKESYYVFQSYWTEKPMAHIYGHNWPVRWGDKDELKEVKVYSNCHEAELYLNGVSLGKRKRNSQDFPAAGLRWNVAFNDGKNQLKVIARKGKTILTDEIMQTYQTEKWGKPAKLTLSQISRKGETVTVEARLYDENSVLCLDATNFVSFSVAGDGRLIVNTGTTSGSRKVQLYNGRAIIRLNASKGKSIVAVKSEGLPVAFCEVNTMGYH